MSDDDDDDDTAVKPHNADIKYNEATWNPSEVQVWTQAEGDNMLARALKFETTWAVSPETKGLSGKKKMEDNPKSPCTMLNVKLPKQDEDVQNFTTGPPLSLLINTTKRQRIVLNIVYVVILVIVLVIVFYGSHC